MKAKLMLCLCLLLAATTMFAQNLTVTGVVTEQDTRLSGEVFWLRVRRMVP